jgi:hypothetical protein
VGSNAHFISTTTHAEEHNSTLLFNQQKSIILANLSHQATKAKHIDELFSWLSYTIAQQLYVDVVQCWALQMTKNKQQLITLRAIATRQQALPLHVVANRHITEITRQAFDAHRGMLPQPARAIFSPYQANLLTLHNLHYWGCYYIYNPTFLPPIPNNTTNDYIASPLTLIVSFFTRQTPAMRLIPTIGYMIEHTIPLARKHRLLYDTPLSVEPQKELPATTLASLVPQRIRYADATQELIDRQLRRLYLAIDGQKNISRLAAITQLNNKALIHALHTLLRQGYIRLCRSDGEPIDEAQFIATLSPTQ